MRTVYSFSAKTKKDMEFVEKLKEKNDAKGINFSYIVLQALKLAYPEDAKDGHKH